MEKEYVMQVAQTIKEQLVALTPMTVLMSWGIKEFAEIGRASCRERV